MKIAFVIGTKAELIKCMPIMAELQRRKQDYLFIHTGQHSLSESCTEFRIKKPDYVLSKERKLGSKLKSEAGMSSWIWFFSMIFRIRRILKKLGPEYVIYHGDTISTGAAAIGSSRILNPFKKWKNVHLEAGLRSGSLTEPFPEEIVRRVADGFSDILLAVSELSMRNLKRERPFFVHGRIINAGNTVIDSAAIAYSMAKKKFSKEKREYALINMHRHENLKSEERMRKIINIIKNLEIRAIWPMHENTRQAFISFGMMRELENIKNLEIRPLCGYPEFVFLEANCRYLVVDGGSIQEESLIFRKPCILLREKTERQEGLSTGINFLTKLNIDYAKKTVKKILSKDFKVPKFKNPYGKEGISEKIVDLLK